MLQTSAATTHTFAPPIICSNFRDFGVERTQPENGERGLLLRLLALADLCNYVDVGTYGDNGGGDAANVDRCNFSIVVNRCCLPKAYVL